MVLSMDRWVGKVAVVTGASAGIGAAISEKLVENGLQVIGIARRKEKLEQLFKKFTGKRGQFHAFQADLTNEEEILKAFQWITENFGPIHILVNNAGVIHFGSLTNGDADDWKKVLDVNVLGLCIATREAIKNMKENNIDGHIIHINSIAGHKVPNIANINIYPASKFAVTALTETLRLELNALGSKIKVTSISPGATKTEYLETSNGDPNDIQLSKAFKIALESEDIADAAIYVLSTPPHVQVHELTVKPVNEEF